MPAVSKKQQKFMGIVRAIQKGEEPSSKFSKDAQDAAKSMKKSSVKKYAKTKHGNLPVKKESISKSQIKKMRDEFDKTGELPPHLKKIAKGKKEFEKKFKVKDIEIPGLEWMKKLGEAADRDYKAEYKKFQSSTKAKKYRAELNKYNRKKGTYGNGDGKDASHKGGKIVGFESQSKNRGRAEKSRLKKESYLTKLIDEAIDEYQVNEGTKQMIQIYKDLDKKFKNYDSDKIADFNKVDKYLKTKFSKGSGLPDTIASFYQDYKGGEDMKKNINRLTKYAKKMIGYKKESVEEYSGMSKWQRDRLDQRSKEKGKKPKKVSKVLQKKRDAWAKKYYTKGGGLNIAKWKKDGSPAFPKESVKEADLGLTYKKGKTVKVKHKTSGKSIVIIDKPNVRKEYEKIGFYAEGFGGDLNGNDKKKFEKARKENAEQLGYEVTGVSDIKESVNERRQYQSGSQEMNFIVQQLVKYGNTKSDAIKMTQKHYNHVIKRYRDSHFIHPTKKAAIISSLSANESVNESQKKFASKIVDKFDQAYLKFSREVRDVIKMMDRSTGSKVDGKIIDKAYSKGLIPLDKLMKSWNRGQQSNPKIDEKVNEDVQDLKKVVKELENASKMHLAQSKRIQSHLDDMNVDEKVIKVSKKDDVPGNAMKMSGEEKIKKLTYSGSNGKGSYEIKGKNLNVIGIRPRDKGFFVRHFTMKTGFRKANLYYDGVNFMDKNKKF